MEFIECCRLTNNPERVKQTEMKAEDLKTPDDIERYIEGCLNDFENGISTKSETTAHLGEMAVQIYKQTLKESAQLSQQPSNDTHTDHFVEATKRLNQLNKET